MKKIILWMMLPLMVTLLNASDKETLSMYCNDGDKKACEALSLIKKEEKCIGGDSKVCTSIAMYYHNLKGVAIDFKKAFFFYKKACEKDNATACNNLGVLYKRGEGVRVDYHEALKYCHKSCELNDKNETTNGCKNEKVLEFAIKKVVE